jgi:hypothetical protein
MLLHGLFQGQLDLVFLPMYGREGWNQGLKWMNELSEWE